METTAMPPPAGGEEADASSSSPLDLRHAPLLLFDDHGEGKATDGDGMFQLYSIPSKQAGSRRRAGSSWRPLAAP